MKNLYLLVFLFAGKFFFSQSTITVLQSDSGNPISNASVFCDQKLAGKTASNGKLSFKGKCKEVSVKANGFYEDETVLDKVMEIRLTKTEAKTQSIEKIVINDKSDSKALAILKKVNDNFKKNSPTSLVSYAFKSYEKISFDFDQDTIKDYSSYIAKRVDSLKNVTQLKEQTEEEKKDSLEGVNVMKMMTESKLFLWERASEFLYSKKYGEKINILDNRISGLKNPIYEMLTLRSNRNQMPREVKEENRNLYRYFLTDSIEIEGRKNYVIRFRETNFKTAPGKRKFNGYVYIDAETFGIKKIESNSNKKNEGSITSIWIPYQGKWFLSKENMKLKAGSMAFNDEPRKKVDETNKDAPKTKRKRTKFGNYVFMNSTYFDHQSPIEEKAKDFSGYTLTVKNSDGSLLEKYRTDSLDVREQNTYVKIDSVGKKYKIDQKTGILSAALRGKLRFGKVDFDLLQLFRYNKYEGFRIGAGLKLNEKFHKYISPDAYVGYGFKDHTWKYGFGVDVRTSLERNSIFRAEYYDDVTSAGRFNENMWSFKMKVNNGGIELNNSNFYGYKGYKLSYETDLSNSVTVKVAAKKDQEEAKFNYNFKNLGSQFENFSTIITLKYAPFSKNMMTPMGKFTFEQNYPELYLNFEKGFKSLGGELDFSRWDALLIHQMKTKAGTTSIRLHGGLVNGDTPIWHHFTMNGLSGQQPKLNLNFTSYLGFATMTAGRFYNDKFAGMYLSHRIPWYFRTIGRKASSFDVVYRGAIGNMKNPEFHNFNFQKMDHLYQEVGLEWNHFLSTNFNLGFFHKVGYYNTGNFKQDFAVQIKIQDLGF